VVVTARDIRSKSVHGKFCLAGLLLSAIALVIFPAVFHATALTARAAMTENSTPQSKLARLREIVTETPNVVPLRPALAHMVMVASEPPIEMNGIIGSLLQFDKGTHFKGRKERYDPTGKVFRWYNSTDAWRYMNNGIHHDRTIWRGMVEPFPKRSELGEHDQSLWPINPFNGKPDDPWKHSYFRVFARSRHWRVFNICHSY
jgi:hypothetical protein